MKNVIVIFHLLTISGFCTQVIGDTVSLNQESLLLRCAHSSNSISAKLFTSRNNEDGYELSTNLTSTDNFDKINKNSYTKIIIPGWQFLGVSLWPQDFIKEYLSLNSSFNIILMHWEESEYFRPAVESCCISETGFWMAKFLDFLQNQGVIDYGKTHILGHSFGAHVAGNVGRYVEGKISRITALDPGIDVAEDIRLKKSDAVFIDVIHTSQLGNAFVQGHIDFYPNGGLSQTNYDVFASHTLAVRYMLESIGNPRAFPALKCACYMVYNMNDCSNKIIAYMGEHVDQYQTGQFFLETKEKNNTFGTHKIFRKILPKTQRQLYMDYKKALIKELRYSETNLCIAIKAFTDKVHPIKIVKSVASLIMNSVFRKLF